jgi:hypothetical protein
MLEAVYFVVANVNHLFSSCFLSRVTQILFGISTASAILVTTVTYGVLVPGAIMLPQPEHRAGMVTVLFSWQGHTMHSLNTLFMLCDTYLSKQIMQPKDAIYGLLWGGSYVLFEWIFHQYTNMWHYPFMDYNKPAAPVIYMVLLAVFMLYWFLGCKISARAAQSGENKKGKKQM